MAYGKVFKYDDDGSKGEQKRVACDRSRLMGSTAVTACVSFGGLLMMIIGTSKHLSLEMDNRIYLLLRKVTS